MAFVCRGQGKPPFAWPRARLTRTNCTAVRGNDRYARERPRGSRVTFFFSPPLHSLLFRRFRLFLGADTAAPRIYRRVVVLFDLWKASSRGDVKLSIASLPVVLTFWRHCTSLHRGEVIYESGARGPPIASTCRRFVGTRWRFRVSVWNTGLLGGRIKGGTN